MILAQVHLLTADVHVELMTSRQATVRVTKGHGQIWAGIPRKWTPWKLTGGDIDGNGLPDFAVGIVKQTHLYPHPHKTIFFFELRNGEIRPKWRGSSLGRPLEDFVYAQSARGPRLVALQSLLDHKRRLFVWRWNRFGFRLESEHGNWSTANFGKIEPENIEIVTQSGSEWVKL